jgi:hypothetical protein
MDSKFKAIFAEDGISPVFEKAVRRSVDAMKIYCFSLFLEGANF